MTSNTGENMRSLLMEKYCETLTIKDLMAFAKKAEFTHVTDITMYDKHGLEFKVSLDKKKSKKWKQLKQEWNK